MSDEEHDRIVREYERCKDIRMVVEVVGRSRHTVCSHLRREGIEIERRERKGKRKDKRMYKEDLERPVFTRYKLHFPIR